MQKVHQKYYIDSHNRISGTHEDFLYRIDMPILDQASAEGLKVVCLSAVVPKSYYLIRDGTFTLHEDALSATINIPLGNYTASGFRTMLSALLTASSPSLWTYTVTLSTLTGKFSYSSNATGTASFDVPSTGGLFEQLGFDRGDTAVLPCVSSNVIKFVSEDTVYIHSDMIGTPGNDILIDMIAAGVPDLSNIGYRNTEVWPHAKDLNTKNGNCFRFRISNEDDETLSLNGLNVVITILIYRQP